ncbi:hypothetical protein F5Y16DRAFT_73440 [Xylariaceae sp. FL0255]|nr:hypothetical protein F5Y16DRAFT_73440 [Xylariaceae sp. FL0255]
MDAGFWVAEIPPGDSTQGATYMSRCPLSMKAEEAFGVVDLNPFDDENEDEDAQHTEDIAAWRRGSAFFSKLEKLQKAAQWEDFAATLSPQQASSWSLLSDWVLGAYHPPQLAHAARQAISERIPKRRMADSIHAEFPDSAMLDASVYQFEMSELFASEFLRPTRSNDSNLDDAINMVETHRRLAARWATSQRIAHATYASIAGLPVPAVSPQDSTQAVEQAIWRDDGSANSYYPAYLWSISQKRTVDCFDLTPKPSYVCISHTWGRWRTEEMVALDGVPWKVPQNTVFGAENIHSYLNDLADKIDTDFVWFDLVCIPQTREGPMGVVAEREIARQAAIFRGSIQCLAWFSYIDSWKSEQHLIEWLSLQYLHLSTTSDLYQAEPHLTRYRTLADDNPLQLTRHPAHAKYLGRDIYPFPRLIALWRLFGMRSRLQNSLWKACNGSSVWFSSLWTLQELSVCPHMILMSRDWVPLRDASGSEVTFEHLKSFSIAVWMLMLPIVSGREAFRRGRQKHLIPKHPEKAVPRGAILLYNMIQDTSLPIDTDRSRTEILIQGNRRHCAERRAEAIMSAIGVTDWFDPTCENERDLILGVYPIPFVWEAARKCGPEFAFANTLKDTKCIRRRHGHLKNVRGSLLPFSPLDKQRRRGIFDIVLYPIYVQENTWNSAFDYWMFMQDGSVRMTAAAILGELTGEVAFVVQPVRVYLCYQGPSGTMTTEEVSLHEWLQRQSKHYWTFAANISKKLGIILQGLRHKRSGNDLTLVKVGAYQILGNIDHPETTNWIDTQALNWISLQRVDWVVL